MHLVLKSCVKIMQNNYILGISEKFLPVFWHYNILFLGETQS